MSKYIVMDIVFYASSLNYDWGGGTNYQELKKITKWDGRQYVLVSRYALRYSILHWANKLFPEKWKLAGSDVLTGIGENEVARLFSQNEFKEKVKKELEKELKEKYKKEGLKDKEIKKIVEEEIEKEYWRRYREFLANRVFYQYPEFDLFGFMIAEGGGNQAALTRVSPVKISHAISLTPTNIDAHTMANLDMKRRAGGKGSNPVTIEEKADFYAYNITIDVGRIGKYLINEHGKKEIGNIELKPEIAKERIVNLIDTVLNLKRDIKGRREDLSPWLMIIGLYENGRYETFADKIVLDRKTHYKVKRKYRKIPEDDGELEIIENQIEEGLMPLFWISANEIERKLPIYYRKEFCDFEPKDKFEAMNTKKDVLKKIKEFIGYEEETAQ